MYAVKVGDVLMSDRGSLRVVRRVSRFECGALRAVAFAIKRCSWTRRPSTTYSYTDIKRWTPTGASVELDSPLDEQLRQCLADHRLQLLHSWDVVGVLP